ncbi:XdhC family protein [Sagittula sp. SSi028]|uniref:XdhC family protein n=1 Tax=Sagittula sp. SSi028 TaxID=3400636 RepID=UPI003AF7FB59
MDRFEDIPQQALAWHNSGIGAVLATVIETWGSAPRRVGSQLAISGRGEIAGSVSGGCVEGAVIVEALEALEDGDSRELEFGVSDQDAFAVGLACGGTIRILVEPVGGALPVDLLDRLCKARQNRTPTAYVANLDSGERRLVEAANADTNLADRFRADRSGFDVDSRVFVGVHNPPLRLIVVGAVHIAQALVPMARIAGYDPFVVDPRDTFASAERFPDTPLLHEWPDEAVQQIGLDSCTALVLLTHDPKLDDPALESALRSNVFYIGALGSTRTHAKRQSRMEAAGFTAEQIARIHGPVGLSIGAAGPAEIAIAIMAEMTQVLRQKG